MRWTNSTERYGAVSMLFHWFTAAAFVVAYIVAYAVIWIVDPETSLKPPLFGLAPDADRIVPVLNVHWVLGLSIGAMALPRWLWVHLGARPKPLSESVAERRLAALAHAALYALLILMPLTGYMTTYDPTDLGWFRIPPCRDTAWGQWLRAMAGLTVDQFEDLMWSAHRFLGQKLAWWVVALHAAAALVHHFIRRDQVLRRMLP